MATPNEADYLASVQTADQVAHSDGMTVSSVDADAAARADAANVVGAWAIDYAAAMDNYAARSDVEPLWQRRAREAAAKVAEQDFARTDTYDGGFSAKASDAPA